MLDATTDVSAPPAPASALHKFMLDLGGNVGSYYDILSKHGYREISDLEALDDAKLRTLGVTKMRPRKLLFNAVAARRASGVWPVDSSTISTAAPTSTSDFDLALSPAPSQAPPPASPSTALDALSAEAPQPYTKLALFESPDSSIPETWSMEAIQLWLREKMGMPHVADAVGKRRKFHGHMMTRATEAVWKALGANTLDANILCREVQRLRRDAADLLRAAADLLREAADSAAAAATPTAAPTSTVASTSAPTPARSPASPPRRPPQQKRGGCPSTTLEPRKRQRPATRDADSVCV